MGATALEGKFEGADLSGRPAGFDRAPAVMAFNMDDVILSADENALGLT